MLVIDSMKGLGDNIYQRAFVRNVGECWLNTPWPQLYRDLPNVHFMPGNTKLRTQAKNVARISKSSYSFPPRDAAQMRVFYRHDGIMKGMFQCFGVQPGPFDLPSFGPSRYGRPYAVIRPATVRAEWPAPSRNCKPEYVNECAAMLRAQGISVIAIADLEDGKEWIVGDAPECDHFFFKGELKLEALMALIEHAWLVVGPIGWIVPACLAYRTPAWIIAGGYGGFNHPSLITDDRYMDTSNIHFAMPDNFCHCKQKDHSCDKTITAHRDKFRAYLVSRS